MEYLKTNIASCMLVHCSQYDGGAGETDSDTGFPPFLPLFLLLHKHFCPSVNLNVGMTNNLHLDIWRVHQIA